MANVIAPFGGVEKGVNALKGLAQFQEQKRRTDLYERGLGLDEKREQRLSDTQKIIDLQRKLQVAKAAVLHLTKERYGTFVNESVKNNGVPEYLFPPAEIVEQMDDKQFKELKQKMVLSAQQFGQMTVAEAQHKLRVAEANHRHVLEKMRMGASIQGQKDVSDYQRENAIKVAEAKAKAKGTKSNALKKDEVQTPDGIVSRKTIKEMHDEAYPLEVPEMGGNPVRPEGSPSLSQFTKHIEIHGPNVAYGSTRNEDYKLDLKTGRRVPVGQPMPIAQPMPPQTQSTLIDSGKTPDGGMARRFSDGTQLITYPDGRAIIKYPDGVEKVIPAKQQRGGGNVAHAAMTPNVLIPSH